MRWSGSAARSACSAWSANAVNGMFDWVGDARERQCDGVDEKGDARCVGASNAVNGMPNGVGSSAYARVRQCDEVGEVDECSECRRCE